MKEIKTLPGVPAYRINSHDEQHILVRAGNSGRWHLYPVSTAGLVRFDWATVCTRGFAAELRKSANVESGTLCGSTFLTRKEAEALAAKKFSAACGLVAKIWQN